MLVVFLLSLGLVYYKRDANKLRVELIQLKAKSEQIFDDKQKRIDEIETRANAYLKKVKDDYEKTNISHNRVGTHTRVQNNNTTFTRNPLQPVQESTRAFETNLKFDTQIKTDNSCDSNYRQLWNTWQGLCLIYGCVD
jgi:hypothetical protein